MQEIISLAADNIITPMVLFFILGVFAGAVKSDLTIPEAVSKGLSLYLMLAIGFKGGIELSSSGASYSLVIALIVAIALSFLLPIVAFYLLNIATRLDKVNSAAIAAHYGSVSVVTFVAATGFLAYRSEAYEGYIVAMLALMETPAIVSGLILARQSSRIDEATRRGALMSSKLAREVFFSGGVVLLIGSFLIGWATGAKGLAIMAPVVEEPFKAVLTVFLMDMGLLVGRRSSDFSAVGWPLVAFGVYMPLIGGAIGLLAASFIGLSVGGMTLVAVLAASASYIVVPAAMRLSLPQANPAIYVTLSLAITFPFNLVIGIPLYFAAARMIA